jgi:NAD(P) transhydrogenase subunit alpha
MGFRARRRVGDVASASRSQRREIAGPMPNVFVPREKREGESRVAATPETVKRLVKDGLTVRIERGAGEASGFRDDEYTAAGAQIDESAWASADVVLTVGPVEAADASSLREGAIVIGLLAPYRSDATIRTFCERKTTSLALELLPRTTRAQPMDALSSQASIAGYKAAILAAQRLPKYFPLLMTAAGTVRPARVVVIGAGVAGLQAIATCKRLGAMVEVSDVRRAAKQDAESLGAKFIEVPVADGDGKGGYAKELTKAELEKQQELVGERIAAAHAVIATALVPGRPAPKLVPASVVARMRGGSIIVDLAAPEGGNCELTEPGRDVVTANGVTILGPTNLASTVAADASLLYARNCAALLALLVVKGELAVDLGDDVVLGALLTHAGAIRHEATAKRLEPKKTTESSHA